MRKLIASVLTVMMILAIAGCGKTGIESAGNSSDVEVYDNGDGTKYYEGRMGSTMATAWFDFTVNDAYITDEFDGYTPSEGNVFVVVDMTLTNTFNESVDMYTYDFQLQWGDDADDAFEFPIESNEDLIDGQFNGDYTLKIKETKQGYYIFEAPEGNKDFSVSFLEYFDDDSEGNLYFVYFTADEK